MNTQEITTHLKLPFQFDEKRLLDDLSVIMKGNWIPHFNTNGYEGEWKVIPLYSPDGSVDNIYAHPGVITDLIETSALKDCSYFQKVIDTFQCKIITARLLRLGVGAEIKPHTDHELGYENDNFRIHVPVVTNDQIEFMLNDELLVMKPGECWYTNVNYVHSVKNNGDTDRVHLVIDCERNAWSDDLFFSLAPADSFRPKPKPEESPEELKKILAELKRSNHSNFGPLIEELETKLANIENK